MPIGLQRLVEDLAELGFNQVSTIKDSTNLQYAIIHDFTIPAGSFEGKIVDLAIPAPERYPQQLGASMHLRSKPQIAEKQHIPNVRNVTDSNLGDEWRYWSYRFEVPSINPTAELITQINAIFKRN